MHLSTSSSNDRLPKGSWMVLWLVVLVLVVVTIVFFEWHLRNLGWSATVTDSAQLWSEQRKRASKLGDKAIVLIGSSRIQLGMDIPAIRNKLDLEPVQLAIDGTSFLPVLENLADDPNIKGVVLLSIMPRNLHSVTSGDRATEYLNYYRKSLNEDLAPFQVIHNNVVSIFNNSMVTRISGAKPYTVISTLAFLPPSEGNYLVTHTNRSRDVDYQTVPMPAFYVHRVRKHYGKALFEQLPSFSTYDEFLNIFNKEITNIKPLDKKPFLQNLEYLLSVIRKIESNGAKVILIRFPTDKFIWEIDNHRYPRELYWNEIAKNHKASIHFKDYPRLGGFDLPDGSHLDYRDKEEFTNVLMDIIMANKFL